MDRPMIKISDSFLSIIANLGELVLVSFVKVVCHAENDYINKRKMKEKKKSMIHICIIWLGLNLMGWYTVSQGFNQNAIYLLIYFYFYILQTFVLFNSILSSFRPFYI